MNTAVFDFMGGFLIFSPEAFFELDLETLVQAIWGTIEVGSAGYRKLVLKSQGHGFLNERGFF